MNPRPPYRREARTALLATLVSLPLLLTAPPAEAALQHRQSAPAKQGNEPRHAAMASLRFSTYLGGSDIETGNTLALDREGNLYVAGHTASPDFPSTQAAARHQGGTLLNLDVYVAKFTRDGVLVYATYLGGRGDETASALAVDEQGRVLVAGGTTSNDFPTTTGALHGYRSGTRLYTDGFLARLSADGTTMEYATYLGGTGDDAVTGLALDAQGRVYLSGATASSDFPTMPAAFQPDFAGGLEMGADAFVARFRPEGATLTLDYATYLGGSLDDAGSALAVEAGGRVYVTGFTNSYDFPTTPDAFQASFAGPLRPFEGDGFVARFTDDGTLDYATYLGGSRNDQPTALALDAAGHAHVTGWTRSHDFPTTTGAYQAGRRGAEDVFLVKMAPDGSALRYATYFGGTGDDRAYSLVLDAAGQPVLGGSTTSEDLPLGDPVQDRYGGGALDAFLAHFDALGATLIGATFLGGRAAELVSSVSAGPTGDVCLTGGTGSVDYPQVPAQTALLRLTGTFQDEAFVTCLGEAASGVPVEAPLELPDAFALHPNYPNPFNPTTTIRFDVKAPTRVRLTVYDVQGRKLATLVDAGYTPGRFAVTLDASRWASGVYFYVAEMAGYREARQMVLVK